MEMVREWCREQGDDRRALEDVFGRIDRNNSGRITKREFDDVLLDMKLDASRYVHGACCCCCCACRLCMLCLLVVHVVLPFVL